MKRWKKANTVKTRTHSLFRQLHISGAEVDLVIEFGLDDYCAVAIKANRTPSLKKGFHIACEDLKVKQKFVVYTGEDKFPSNHNTTILSLAHFIEELRI